jgi:hypothetical protein
MHPGTAARAYYSCPNYHVSTFRGFFIYNISWIEHLNDELKCLYWCRTGRCAIFQWIDGPEMVDPRILLFRQKAKKLYNKYKRWVPPPPNPPPMTDEEKKIAIDTRMANPPLCYCGVPAKIHRMMPGAPYTPQFKC